MKKYYLTVRDTFSASHVIPGHPKCGNMHGHNYKVEVVFEALKNPDKENGMIVDFGILKEIVQSITQKRLDHKHLNDIIPAASAENIAEYIYLGVTKELIDRNLTNRVCIYEVRIWETDRFSVSFRNL